MNNRTKIGMIAIGIIALSSLGFQSQNYQRHSIFLFSFTRYIQWPEESNTGDFDILVLGESPITPELKKMADVKKVGDRSIKIYTISSVSDIKKCNILFVPSDKSVQLSEILSKVGASPILVVTEQEGMGAKGSNINFIIKEGKLAFEINQATLNKKKLKASTELSRLAIMI